MRYIFYILLFLPLITLPEAMAESVKIWHVADQKFISEKTLIKNLAGSKNILLGIRPDNPGHHRRAAKIIGNLARMGQRPVILLSYVERNKQNAFAIFAQRKKDAQQDYDATGLDMLLNWSRSGQPDWNIVKPVFDMAIIRKLPLKAVNFSRYEIGQLHHKGLDGLPNDVKPDLLPLLSAPMKEKIKTQITKELREAYCDILPSGVLAKFTMIHQARNGLFALAMTGTGLKTAILIAPQNHVLKDTGVPRYLNNLGETGKSFSLSFVEAGQDMRDNKVDFIWYTDKISRPRPCE